MAMRKIIKLFRTGNVSVSGLMGSGKDMLMSNVVVRRKRPYISNVNYGGEWIRFDPLALDIGNSWEHFLKNDVRQYIYPYPEDCDFYLSDGAVYTPSQYQGELVKKYGYIPFFMCLIRHLGNSRFHYNVQNLNRMWDKPRELSDTYISCKWCKVICGVVIQKVIIYELYDSAVKRVPPFRLRKPLINPMRIQQWEIQKLNYEIAHGSVVPRILIYRNKSTYNTRIFKEMLENGKPRPIKT